MYCAGTVLYRAGTVHVQVLCRHCTCNMEALYMYCAGNVFYCTGSVHVQLYCAGTVHAVWRHCIVLYRHCTYTSKLWRHCTCFMKAPYMHFASTVHVQVLYTYCTSCLKIPYMYCEGSVLCCVDIVH